MELLYILFLFGSLVIYAGFSPQWGLTQFIVAKVVTLGNIFRVWFFADVVSPSSTQSFSLIPCSVLPLSRAVIASMP